MGTNSFLFAQSFITISLLLQRLVDAVSDGNIDEIVALLTIGIDVNITLEVFLGPTCYAYFMHSPISYKH